MKRVLVAILCGALASGPGWPQAAQPNPAQAKPPAQTPPAQAPPAQAPPAQAPPAQAPPAQAPPAQAPPAQAPPAQAPPAQAPPAQAPPAQTAPQAPTVAPGSLNLRDASLTEVIDALCRTLKINYILDPRVKGSVTLNSYGQVRQIDARNLLEMVLRLNGATMVQVGDFYRIVPMADAARLPISPTVDPKSIPDDDRIMLNLVFLKYATVSEVSKIIEPFIGEGAKTIAYGPANLLMILDSHRQMRRTMELISLFDSDILANQRVRLFEVKNGSPTAIAKEMDSIMKAVSLSSTNSVVRFLPVDRINTIIAIAPNPGAFDEIEKWIAKLDTEIKVTAGAVDVYVYRVKYSRAEALAGAIMQLYGGYGYGGYGMGGYGMGGYGMGGYGGYGGGMGGYGGYGMGGYGMGGYGMGGYGGYGGGMGGYGGYGMGGYGGGGMGGYGGYGMGGMPMMGGGMYPGGIIPGYAPQGAPAAPGGTAAAGAGAGGTSATGTDQTGTYLGAGGMMWERIPRVIPNPMDNTLLIQGTPQEYQQISKLLRELDIPPRQVLIDAKIYEVTLSGAFASGVSAFLQKRTDTDKSLTASLADGVAALSIGALVGQSRELLAYLQLAENQSKSKVLSTPSIIATDSLPASINVGSEVPVLSSQSVTPIQSGGSSLFANTISSRSTGVNLNILARVNPSGIVTLVINQEVSAPQGPTSGGIQSPSFSRRAVSTQVTVQDGDTIAIGGIINETSTSASAGIPVLHKIPIVGSVFGSRSYSSARSELIIFMTPRVIYDTNQIVDASEEIKSRVRKLRSMVKE